MMVWDGWGGERGDNRIRRGEGAAGFSREDECCWCWCWGCLRLLRLSPTERDSHLPGLECEEGWRPSTVASPPVWPWVESCFMSFIAVRVRFCSCRWRWQIVPLHDRAQTVEGWNRFPSVAYSSAQRRLWWWNISCADCKWGMWGQALFTPKLTSVIRADGPVYQGDAVGGTTTPPPRPPASPQPPPSLHEPSGINTCCGKHRSVDRLNKSWQYVNLDYPSVIGQTVCGHRGGGMGRGTVDNSGISISSAMWRALCRNMSRDRSGSSSLR